MFTTKVSAILTAIRARAAAYTAAADQIETAAREAESARIQATERIAAAVQFITDVPPGITDNGVGQDKVFTDALDAAIGTLGSVADQPATEPDVAVPPAKPARKRGIKTPSAHVKGVNEALIIPHGQGVRIVTINGIADGPGDADALSAALASDGLTVYRSYDAWDARPVA